MNNYKIYITKADNGLFVGFTNDYNIAIEEKTEEKAFKVVSGMLRSFIIEDVKAGRKVISPTPTSFDQMKSIVEEYKINNPLIVREISIPDIVLSKESLKSERINITLPKYLKVLAEKAGLSPSKIVQESLMEKLGI